MLHAHRVQGNSSLYFDDRWLGITHKYVAKLIHERLQPVPQFFSSVSTSGVLNIFDQLARI